MAEKSDNKLLGQRICNRRKGLNLSQEVLAESAGLSSRQVGNIESGIVRTSPKVNTVVALARALVTCSSYLLGDMRISLKDDEPTCEDFIEHFMEADELKQRAIKSIGEYIMSENVVVMQETLYSLILREMT